VILTKYFNGKRDLAHYEAGSFKIGTLAEYRNSEHLLARMRDAEEGCSNFKIDHSDGVYENVTLLHKSAEGRSCPFPR